MAKDIIMIKGQDTILINEDKLDKYLKLGYNKKSDEKAIKSPPKSEKKTKIEE